MNRRKFLGVLGLAPAGFAFKNPVSGWLAWLFAPKCQHKDKDGKSTWIYWYNATQSGPDRAPFAGDKMCMQCMKREKIAWVSYRFRYTASMPPGARITIRHIDGDKTLIP